MTQAGIDPFATAPAPSAPGEDPFGTAAPKAARSPRVMDLGVGRLVMLRPCAATTETVPAHPSVLKATPGATVQRMTADLVVLDGAPFMYGGKPELDGTPHTITGQPGERYNRVWFNQVGLVSQCMTTDGGAPRFGSKTPWALGRLERGVATNGNPPWLISRKLTDADLNIARAWFTSHPEFS